jgi:hypothetical protein
MKLNTQQLQQIHDDGYLVLKGMVPRVMVDAARQAINHHMGEYGMPPDELNTYRAQTYCRSITRDAVLTDLFNKTPVFSACEQLVGEGNLLPASSAQIALRFPRPDTEPQEPRGHIDGQGTGTNGIPRGSRAMWSSPTTSLCTLPSPTPAPTSATPPSFEGAMKMPKRSG